jgi:hypothetical protein
MSKSFVFFLLLLGSGELLSACAPASDSAQLDGRPTYCDQDNRICPDGSIVMRTGVKCEFVCPEQKTGAAGTCDYGAPDRRYFSRFADVCSQIPAECNAGEKYFKDSCGCGCILKQA